MNQWMLPCFQVIKHLRYSSISVPPLYEELFKKAIWTFQHQRVYDPSVEDIVHLLDIPNNLGDDLDFLGPYPWCRVYDLFWMFRHSLSFHCTVLNVLRLISLTNDTLLPQDIVKGIAKGDLDPFTKIPFQVCLSFPCFTFFQWFPYYYFFLYVMHTNFLWMHLCSKL